MSSNLNQIINYLRYAGLMVMESSKGSGVYYIDGLRHTTDEILEIWGSK
jgi:hypothetical protein